MQDSILKYALWNAVKFEGKANPNTILGRILGEFPEARTNKEKTLKEITETINKVNSMAFDEQKKLLKDIDNDLLEDALGTKKKIEAEEKKKEGREKGISVRKELPDLPNAVMGKVVTRIPPEPSKYNHIGHAMSFLINYMYSKKYNGKCIMRFEDTNPEKSAQEYVDAMYEDVCRYLDVKPDKVVFFSDDMSKFYQSAMDLIKREEVYVCNCEQEIMRDNRQKGIECEHRTMDADETEREWNSMINGDYKEGEAVLRLKIDMQNQNAVLRDPVIFRIAETPHFRQGSKYRVWPMYDFCASLQDAWLDITHVMRSNEFALREPLQNHIRELFGYPNPNIKEYGRITVKGATTKGREIRALIESGQMIGWHDPRLVTLRALEHRGILKQTFYDLATEVGMSKTETPIDWTLISSINRKYLDENCNRYFFIADPIKIKINGAPDLEIELSLHPHKRKGGRKFKTKDEFYIAKTDFDSLEDGEILRLMDCLNIKVDSKKAMTFSFHSKDYEMYKQVGGKRIIHYLPADKNSSKELEELRVFMPDATYIKGLAEPLVRDLEESEIVQFERFGFCKKNEGVWWFCHK